MTQTKNKQIYTTLLSTYKETHNTKTRRYLFVALHQFKIRLSAKTLSSKAREIEKKSLNSLIFIRH